ncbi:ATP-binding protein [Mycobacterium sp. E3339]|uniref:ATP-binding protein n=1 Tax=Mycobacterium sp. E3339 TaxID=1834146 RepID=UPI002101B724|nr:ATP-binding protein [Mycobacterium sp. E3339]
MRSGPPVCVLSGFSGVGKTALAGELFETVQIPCVYVAAGAEGFSLDDLLLTIASELERIGLPSVARDQDDDLLTSLSRTARTDQLIIVDDFDYLLDERTGLPPAQFTRFLDSLTPDFTTKLRLLIIANRVMPEGIWEMDQVVTTALDSLSSSEAENFLKELLGRESMLSHLSDSEIKNVVRWLGGNPSAMKSLVQCLRFEPIEKIVELDPEGWELKNRVVSPRLVRSLEKKFLGRCLGHLDQDLRMLLEFLSVYRRSFRYDAISRLAADVIDIEEATRQLISRYLLTRSQNWYAVNPVVRELCLPAVQNNNRRAEMAYNKAADHYSRHFRQVNHNQSLTSHGMEFVEAKYHLWRAGQLDEFENIAATFRRQLLRAYGSNLKLPKAAAEREQLLFLLNGALQGYEDKGYANLRWLLARLLLERNQKDDDLLALRQLRISARESRHIEVWRPLVQLSARLEGARTAESVARQGFNKLAVRTHADLYRAVIEGYEDEDLMPDAVRLVDEGLTQLDVEGQIDLAATIGRLLTKAGQTNHAIAKLIEIYRAGVLSDAPLYWRPLEQAIFIAHGKRDVSQLKRIQDSLEQSEITSSVAALCECLIYQQGQRYRTAALAVDDFISKSQTVAAQAAFSWLCCSELDRAQDVIQSISLPNNRSGIWILGCTYYCLDRIELARECIESLDGKPFDGADGEIPARLISIWDDVPSKLGPHPAFYFPILPGVFTGLDGDLHRTWGGPSVIAGRDLHRLRLPKQVGRGQQEGPDSGPQQLVNVRVDTVSEYSKYRMNNVTGAVGDNSTAFVQASNEFPLSRLQDLVDELKRVRSEVDGRRGSFERDVALVELDGAITAAASGDAEATKSRLKKAGEWTLGVATTIGAGLAVAAIKASIGLT